MALDKNDIARRIAKEVKDGYYVNLGIGIPTLVANYVRTDISVEFQNKQANAFLHVYNNMGQLVLDSKIEPFKKINISALSEGVFFYVIETESIHFNGKLVKIK